MAAVTITVDDLAPFATIEDQKAAAMIADAMALAARIAPCITEEEFAYPDAAKALLRGAILRWNEAGAGAVTQEQVGPFGHSIDQSSNKRGRFWPSEITDLEKLCKASTSGAAFTIDTAPGFGSIHADTCALNFGANYCSCGVDIAGYPIYGV